ncbi:MAG TPA: sialidase family protein [Chloroflexota bacterium]|nr:sialidase family protein [Chloroflexota bacterium]
MLGNGQLADYIPNASAICSNNSDQLFAFSSDNGTNWSARGDIQAAVGGNNFDTQHSRLDAAPDGSVILYTDQYGNAVRSTDGGNTWKDLIGTSSGLGNDAPVGAASSTGPYYTFQFQTASSVYAIHEWFKAPPEIFQSADGGATWTVPWKASGAIDLHGVAGAAPSTLFFAGGTMGLQRSSNLGGTWQSIGTFAPQVSAVALSPNYATDHTVFTVSFPSGTVSTGGQDTGGFGIYRSTNSGTTWSEPEAPNLTTSFQFGDVYSTSLQGGLSLAASPAFAADHTIFEGDRIGTVVSSHDGGVTWTSLPISNQAGWYINALTISPRFASDHAVYAGLGNLGFGVVRSADGGQTWTSEVPKDRFNEITQAETWTVAVSPEASGLMDLAMGVGDLYLARDNLSSTAAPEWIDTGLTSARAIAMSPSYQTDCTMYASMWGGPSGISNTLDDGVYVSTDACAANPPATIIWTELTRAIIANSQAVRDFDTIVLSPSFASDHTMFIGSYASGVYVSADGGQTWAPFNTGLGNQRVYTLAIAETGAQSGVLFAATDAGIWQTPVQLVPSSLPPPSGGFHVYLPAVFRN